MIELAGLQDITYMLDRKGPSGVYFLMHKDKVVYVGQTTDIRNRLKRHVNSDKIFDRVLWLPTEPDDLSTKEAIAIGEFDPLYNKIKPPLTSLM